MLDAWLSDDLFLVKSGVAALVVLSASFTAFVIGRRHGRSMWAVIMIALATAATVGMNMRGAWLSSLAADEGQRWAMVGLFGFIGFCTVHLALQLPRLVEAFGWGNVRTLLCLGLMLSGSAISMSQTNVSIAAVIASNQEAVRMDQVRTDDRDAAISDARSRIERAGRVVDALPPIDPLHERLAASQRVLEARQKAVDAEAGRGGCLEKCDKLRELRDDARQDVELARSVLQGALRSETGARTELANAEQSLVCLRASEQSEQCRSLGIAPKPIVGKSTAAQIVTGMSSVMAFSVRLAIMFWIEFASLALPLLTDRRAAVKAAARAVPQVAKSVVSDTGTKIRRISAAEGDEILLLQKEGYTVRGIAREMGRAPSTISAFLKKNGVDVSA